jgi:hypothetical protein
MKKKAEILGDFSQIDINQHLNIWRDTLHVRRRYIRENSTADVITAFPGYSVPQLVSLHSSVSLIFLVSKLFEEVKMLVHIDLCVAIRHQIPILLDRVASVPMFVTGRCAHECHSYLTKSPSRFSCNPADQNPLP